MYMSPVHQVWKGRQRKRWEDNIREWTGLELAKFSGEQRKMEETGCEIICAAPAIFAVKRYVKVKVMVFQNLIITIQSECDFFIYFLDCIVPLRFLPWEIPIA